MLVLNIIQDFYRIENLGKMLLNEASFRIGPASQPIKVRSLKDILLDKRLVCSWLSALQCG